MNDAKDQQTVKYEVNHNGCMDGEIAVVHAWK
jgi:hypothetical protein